MVNTESSITKDSTDKDGEPTPSKGSWDFSFSEYPKLQPLLWMVFLESLGLSLTAPVISFFILDDLGLGTFKLGMVVSAFSLAQILGAALFGRCSDAFGRRVVVVTSFLWCSLGFGAMAFVRNFTELLMARAVAGLSGGTWPICQSYILDVVPEADRSKWVGIATATFAMAFVVGPGATTALLATGHVTRRMIFALAGTSCFLGGLVGLIFLEESLPKENRRPLCGESEQEGSPQGDWEAVNLGLGSMWALKFFIAASQFILYSMYAPLIEDVFGFGDQEMGLLLMCGGVFAVVIQAFLFAPTERHLGPHATLTMGCLAVAISLAILPTVSVVAVHVGIMLLFVLGESYVEPGTPLLIAMYSLPSHLGFANGWGSAFRGFAAVFAPMLGGELYHLCKGCAFYVAAASAIVSGGLAVMSYYFASPVESEEEGISELKQLLHPYRNRRHHSYYTPSPCASPYGTPMSGHMSPPFSYR